MNYYSPNYYSGYSPGAQYQPMTSNPMQLSLQQPALGLNGKIVDGEEMVKVTEVPLGGYGIFPKADMSEVYIKTWNSNGTTSIVSYRPYSRPELVETTTTVDNNTSSILEKIQDLEKKIDSFLSLQKKDSEKKQPIEY